MATTIDAAVSPLKRRAVSLERFTVFWNTIECGAAVVAGVIAGSIALTGFGFDSAIETMSALVVLVHLRADLAGRPVDLRREGRSLSFIAITFFVLAACVSIDSVFALAHSTRPDSSPVGIAITAVSLVVMPVLAIAKLRTGHALGSRLLVADARETQVCVFLSASTLAGLVAFSAFGWWWADPVAALVVAGFALKEGREAWHGELVCDD